MNRAQCPAEQCLSSQHSCCSPLTWTQQKPPVQGFLEIFLAASQLRQRLVLSSPVKECWQCGSCSLWGSIWGDLKLSQKSFNRFCPAEFNMQSMFQNSKLSCVLWFLRSSHMSWPFPEVHRVSVQRLSLKKKIEL